MDIKDVLTAKRDMEARIRQTVQTEIDHFHAQTGVPIDMIGIELDDLAVLPSQGRRYRVMSVKAYMVME